MYIPTFIGTRQLMLRTTESTENISVEIDSTLNNVRVLYSDLCIPVSLTEKNDSFSAHTELLITKLFYTACVPTVFLFEGPTSIVNIIIFFKHGVRDWVNLCLFALAIVDFISLSFYFLLPVSVFSEQDKFFFCSFEKKSS